MKVDFKNLACKKLSLTFSAFPWRINCAKALPLSPTLTCGVARVHTIGLLCDLYLRFDGVDSPDLVKGLYNPIMKEEYRSGFLL